MQNIRSHLANPKFIFLSGFILASLGILSLMAYQTFGVALPNVASQMSSQGGIFSYIASTFLGSPASSSHQQLLATADTIAVATNNSPTSKYCTSTGVGTNSDGSHFFSWLHVDANTNTVRDENNCVVNLRGTETDLSFGDAGASLSKVQIDLLTKNIRLNNWRLSLNPVWWNTNVEVPNAVNETTGQKGMKYQDWVIQVIRWMHDDGLYVELDKGPQFDEPPCGNDGRGTNNSFCAPQDTGSLEAAHQAPSGDPDPADANAAQESSYGNSIDQALMMWKSLAARYSTSPHIWYDSWNEAHNLVQTDPSQWQKNQDALIQAIQALNPKALVAVYMDQSDIAAKLHYSEPNVVIDFHVYDTSWGSNTSRWPTSFNSAVQYAYADKHAVIINEWGGATGALEPQYSSNINTYAAAHAIGLGYYEASNLFNKQTMSLTDTGKAVAVDNVAIPWLKFVRSNSGSGGQKGVLHVVGDKLVAPDGTVTHLYGAMVESSFAYIKDYITKAIDPLATLNDATFNAMKSWGMDVVRLNMSQWIEQADTSKQYLNKLDTAIASANHAGLYVVLDFHDDGQSGAVSPYADGMLHKTSLSWWVALAQHYKDNPMVLFDLINEPKYPNWNMWEHGDGKDIVGLLDVTQAIRQVGVTNIIVLEPGAAGGAQQKGWQGFTVANLTDKDSIVSKHDYGEIPAGFFTSAPTQYWSQDWGGFIGVRPLYYGEWALLPHPNYPSFCKGTNSSNADTVVNSFMSYMHAINANWTAWSFTPTHMIDTWLNLEPTSMQTGAPWSCPVTTGPAMQAGMGADVKAFLQAHP